MNASRSDRKKLHVRHPPFAGNRMPVPLFRDDLVGQENGFVPGRDNVKSTISKAYPKFGEFTRH